MATARQRHVLPWLTNRIQPVSNTGPVGRPTARMSSLPTSAEDVIGQPVRDQFGAFIDEHRSDLNACLDGLTEEQARRSLVPCRTTLLGLVKHATFVEKVWFDEAVTCRSSGEIGIAATPDESFILHEGDTIAAVGKRTARHASHPAARQHPWGSTTWSRRGNRCATDSLAARADPLFGALTWMLTAVQDCAHIRRSCGI